MIINHDFRIVFLHIPKCAGTAVRRALESLNQWQDAGPPWRRSHSDLGMLDYAHLPLAVLRAHFPEAFESVLDYRSFALVRDPYGRFASSVSERIRWGEGALLAKLSRAELRKSLEESIDYLSRQPSSAGCLPLGYIHFQRQCDYIVLDGEALVGAVYPVERIAQLREEMNAYIGSAGSKVAECTASQQHANAALMYRNEALRRAHRVVGPLMGRLRRVLPASASKRMDRWVYVHRDQCVRSLFNSEYVRDFVSSYYADDLELYARVARM
ncbi:MULTISPECIES: sulfotransferase family 2 domain-containing protein [unclassified Thioalkalivibrio]|uniref:sulfotransferase family 2 domain-containing protein n=1 Tax=unclassified Thioalkalivibrio TaxID=2621013 RepID=UPI000571EC5E|nr:MULTISPECIES: sulfotransferase family 2 domain-containing protein [unclassified Thioalkalivibrio]